MGSDFQPTCRRFVGPPIFSIAQTCALFWCDQQEASGISTIGEAELPSVIFLVPYWGFQLGWCWFFIRICFWNQCDGSGPVLGWVLQDHTRRGLKWWSFVNHFLVIFFTGGHAYIKASRICHLRIPRILRKTPHKTVISVYNTKQSCMIQPTSLQKKHHDGWISQTKFVPPKKGQKSVALFCSRFLILKPTSWVNITPLEV